MPRGTGTRQEDDDETVVTTPPETTGPVTVVTEEPKAPKTVNGKNLVRVKGSGSDGRVVLWEKDENHPNGEAFVCNDGKEYQVSSTAAVKRAIAEGSLVKV